LLSTGTGGFAGAIILHAGFGECEGGEVWLMAGNSDCQAGNIRLTAGSGECTAGMISIIAGDGFGCCVPGGDIVITPGTGTCNSNPDNGWIMLNGSTAIAGRLTVPLMTVPRIGGNVEFFGLVTIAPRGGIPTGSF